jgi:hypothetical protein
LKALIQSSRTIWCVCTVLALGLSVFHPLVTGAEAQELEERYISALDVVMFDNSREQFWSPYDAGFFGYSELAISLREAGYVVTEPNLPVTITLADIKPKGSVLVMGPAYGQQYSYKEIDAIVEYVRLGGGLLILAEADASGEDNFQNRLATQFGCLVRNVSMVDTVNSLENTADQWIFANSDFFGVKRIGLPVTGFLMLVGTGCFPILAASDTAIPPRATLGAATTFGEGRVVCIADSQFLINGGKKTIGIGCAQNKQFSLALFDWLAGREKPVKNRIFPEFTLVTGSYVKLKVRVEGPVDITTDIQGGAVEPTKLDAASGEYVFNIDVSRDGFLEFVGSDGSRKRVVFLSAPRGGIGARLMFDLRGHAPDIGDPINGLSKFAAVLRDKDYWVYGVDEGLINLTGLRAVVVVNPVSSEGCIYIGEIDAEDLRWLILTEPFSTLNVHDAVGKWFRDRGFSDPEIPAAALAKRFGIECLPYVVFEEDSSRILGRHPIFPVLSYGVEDCHAFRCGVVSAEGGKPILVASERAWGIDGGLGLRLGRRGMEPGKYDYTNRPTVGIILDKAAVIADLQFFCAQHVRTRGNWALILELANWLAGVEFDVPEL